MEKSRLRKSHAIVPLTRYQMLDTMSGTLQSHWDWFFCISFIINFYKDCQIAYGVNRTDKWICYQDVYLMIYIRLKFIDYVRHIPLRCTVIKLYVAVKIVAVQYYNALISCCAGSAELLSTWIHSEQMLAEKYVNA